MSGCTRCFWQGSLFERFMLLSLIPLIPQVLVTLLTPRFAVLPSLLMQLLVGLQAKNIPPKRSGVVFILTKIIPGICLLACSANICVSTTEGVTNFMSEVRHLGGFAVKGHFLCKIIFKLKLLQVKKIYIRAYLL